MIAGVVGAGVEAAGALQEGNYKGQVARYNAIIADQNADYAIQAVTQQSAAASMKGAARGAAIKTSQAASGIDVNTGSAVDVQASDRMVAQLDAETVLNDAELQAYGYRTQKTNFIAQAQQAETAGIYEAASGLLGAAKAFA